MFWVFLVIIAGAVGIYFISWIALLFIFCVLVSFLATGDVAGAVSCIVGLALIFMIEKTRLGNSGNHPSNSNDGSDNHQVLPARAGMIPSASLPRTRQQSAPRTSGDDPIVNGQDISQRPCSPHERG